ncbi:hypothetical protein A9Q81_24400 [Gammaproteobacteria bacterium 42_54_T18]|nr:hypothetical protein A9Q81_24400 [Gammaproteobacteria bacterium 42_54_T18]
MSCHGIKSIVHLKGVASYQFQPKQDYLFAYSNNPILTEIHVLLVRVRPNQHIEGLGKPILKDPRICASCHAQFMDKDMNNWGWVKMQDEYSAWLKSPFSLLSQEHFASKELQRCQDCHMPLAKSNDPSSDNNGDIRSHNSPSANTFLPLLSNDIEQFEATKIFLQPNKLRINIDTPNREDAVQTLVTLEESLRSFQETPYYFYLNEKATIILVVSNTGVGHDFPGGTIDIGEAWIEFLVLDAEGKQIYASGLVDNEQIVDRQGNHVWKHDLFNMTGESFRRVIKAGESDIVSFSFSVPSWVKSPLTITSTLKYQKLNTRYAKWALKDKYINIPIIDLAWDSLLVPIKIKREVGKDNHANNDLYKNIR